MSKSISATARPSRNTTFSGNVSLWQMREPPSGSAQSSSHPATDAGSNDAAASWKRRNKAPNESSVSSFIDHAGYGGSGASPATKVRTSRPCSSVSR